MQRIALLLAYACAASPRDEATSPLLRDASITEQRRGALVREATNASHARVRCQPVLASLAPQKPTPESIVVVTGFTDRAALPGARRGANDASVDLALSKRLYARAHGYGFAFYCVDRFGPELRRRGLARWEFAKPLMLRAAAAEFPRAAWFALLDHDVWVNPLFAAFPLEAWLDGVPADRAFAVAALRHLHAGALFVRGGGAAPGFADAWLGACGDLRPRNCHAYDQAALQLLFLRAMAGDDGPRPLGFNCTKPACGGGGSCSFAYERAVGAWLAAEGLDQAPAGGAVLKAMRRSPASDAVDRGCAAAPVAHVLRDAPGRPRALCWACGFLEVLDNPKRNFPVALPGPAGPLRTGKFLARDVAANRAAAAPEQGWLLNHKGAATFYGSNASWACAAPDVVDGNVVTRAGARRAPDDAPRGDALASGLLHWPCDDLTPRRRLAELRLRDGREVTRVAHDAARAVVRVEACDGARLFARWSGPALLAPPFRRVGPGVFEAAVDAPVAGDYALEVLHFGCGWELGDAADFQARCLPVPAAVHEPYVAALPATAAGAFWLAGGPRPTRFQRPDCVVAPKRDDGSAKPRPVHTPRCAAETSRDWYNGTFARRAFPGGGPDPDVAGWPGACGLDRGGNLSRVCFVGASHARKLVWAAERLARRARVRDGTLRLEKRATDFKHVDAQFPGDYFKHDLASCGFVVVALGQWAAGWPGGAPTGAEAWAAELRPVVEDLARLRDGGATVALRSIDHIPLGYKQLQCPPTDWRTPFLIDAYNDELRALAAAAAVPFLDTTAVARPIWDLASDWNHLDFGASDAQAAAILVELCGGRG